MIRFSLPPHIFRKNFCKTFYNFLLQIILIICYANECFYSSHKIPYIKLEKRRTCEKKKLYIFFLTRGVKNCQCHNDICGINYNYLKRWRKNSEQCNAI